MKSYLKFLSRNKLYTAIEAVGLAVSLAFVIIIGSYVWQQFAVTREHPDRERAYVPGTPGFPEKGIIDLEWVCCFFMDNQYICFVKTKLVNGL